MFAPLNAGELRSVVQIEASIEVRDAYGASELRFVTQPDVYRGKVEPVIGNERLAAMMVTPGVTHAVRMRSVIGLKAGNRLRVDGQRTFEIVAVIDEDSRGRNMAIACTELV